VPAYLMGFYGGQDSGAAGAEVITGEVNPSGHLPITLERNEADNPTYLNYLTGTSDKRIEYREGIFVGYRGYEKNGTKPLFPFGFGLSYTSFRMHHLRVERAGPARATVRLDVTNTGKRRGATVVQAYITDGHAPVPRPEKELKGFAKVELAPGETRTVSVRLEPRSFAYYDDVNKKWAIAPGKFRILVGDSSANLPLTADIDIEAGVPVDAL
jgi:beta-glucosidase